MVSSSPTPTINWQAPWLAHLPSGLRKVSLHDLPKQLNGVLANHLPDSHNNNNRNNSYKKSHNHNANTKLTTGLGKPLTFIAQEALPADTAYESHIATTGQVPTRDNLHDFFNAAVWLTFPQTKRCLNAAQYAEIERAGIGDARTPLRDALTLFDENGAVLVTANPAIGEALQGFDWQGALVAPRGEWDNPKAPCPQASACVYVFGHALMEQLINPRKPLCAHSIIVQVAADWFELPLTKRLADLDVRLAQHLRGASHRSGSGGSDTNNSTDQPHRLAALTTRSFSPLPVLGVPYFCTDNADPAFYDDAFVFRSGRRKRVK